MIQLEITRALRITPNEYAQVQYESGTEFLRDYIGSDSGFVDYILSTPEYWAWWTNQFEMDARTYLELDTNPNLERWRAWHTPGRIVAEPWKKAIDIGYERMISERIRKEVNHG